MGLLIELDGSCLPHGRRHRPAKALICINAAGVNKKSTDLPSAGEPAAAFKRAINHNGVELSSLNAAQPAWQRADCVMMGIDAQLTNRLEPRVEG